MLGVILFRDTMTFLLFWEMMTGATFILVIFEGEKKEKLKTAINYLVQMHVCLFVLLSAFSIASQASDSTGFDAVAEYFAHNRNYPLFLLFFIGFGIKAGFVPLHTWLPEVHPSASGNVSGFMSGAVIKMGIYGLLRIVSCLQSDLFIIALIILTASVITSVYGISKAARQRDIKRLLAYSSIENIGIIGLGISAGILGACWSLPLLSFSGYAAALLHTFNHSMFKSMLFFAAGTLCKSTHTQIMDKMGGAMRNMPYTAALFLCGSLAICALPPLSGFVSEFILYSGLFSSLTEIAPEQTFPLLLIVLALVLAGGISIFTFTKAFGIPFSGICRTQENNSTGENKSLILPLLIPLMMVVVVGFFSFEALKIISQITENVFNLSGSLSQPMISSLNSVSLVMLLFVVLFIIVYLCRKRVLSQQTVTHAPVWGCGYTAPNSKLQYTATSYSNNFEKLTDPAQRIEYKMEIIGETELFPLNRRYKSDLQTSKIRFIDDLIEKIIDKLSKLAIFQTGKIQHYVLFALLFMAAILILSYTNML
jgi:formate hydrogenlyase subunit 3/multisubunit Na+/H+ antiporter MnhD subunit